MAKDLFGIDFDVLFSELFKIMMNKVTFVGFTGSDHPNRTTLDPSCGERSNESACDKGNDATSSSQ